MPLQILFRCDEGEYVLIRTGLAHKKIQELRSLIPPVTKQFGVVSGDEQRWPIQNLPHTFELIHTRGKKLLRVLVSDANPGLAFINFLLALFPVRDSVIFDARETALAGSGK